MTNIFSIKNHFGLHTYSIILSYNFFNMLAVIQGFIVHITVRGLLMIKGHSINYIRT